MKSTDIEDMFALPLDKEIQSNMDQESKPKALPIKDYNKVTFSLLFFYLRIIVKKIACISFFCLSMNNLLNWI